MCIKELIKLADSLRSQLAKNSILAMTTIMENIPAREIDPLVETILPGILKKAADTNAFIQETADKALVCVCQCCSEMKIFSCL